MRTHACLGMVVLLVAAMVVPVAADEGEREDPAARKARSEAARREMAAEKADFDKRVNAAIDRGATWLKARQRKDGSYPGFSDHLKPRQYNIMEIGLDALVVLTLAHCGVSPDDPAVKKCLLFCKFHYAGGDGSLNLKGSGKLTIYTAATLIMALDALHNPGGGDGGPVKRDRYGQALPPKKARKCKYPKSVRKWIRELVDFIVRNQVKPSGGWRYPGNPLASEDGDTDLSNTQYALLALDAAARCGIVAPPETWMLAAEYVLKEQEKEGLDAPIWLENEAWEPGIEDPPRFLEISRTQARGWDYLPGENDLATGSMGAAGVTCLGIVKERLWVMKKLTPKLRSRIDRGMLDGLAWLSENFTVTDNPTPGGASMWHYYYLYGLERTGAKVGVRWIGRNDWYRVGGEYLLNAQEKNGGWKEPDDTVRPADSTESAITQTCFALLFLKRSTPKPFAPMLPPITGDGRAPVDGR